MRSSAAEIAEWRARLRSVEDIAGAASADHAVRGLGRARILRVAFVSSGFFASIRPQVLAGRLPESGERGSVVVSERVLREGGIRPSAALGMTLTVLDGSFTVASVLPADVGIPEAMTDIWLPAEAADAVALIRNDDRRFGLLGRLRAGATGAQAAAEATQLRQALWKGDNAERRTLAVGVVATEEQARGPRGTALLAFLVGGIVILLVSTANVASLLISRTIARERELAVSLALGASGRRVALLLFSEAVILSALGGALGLGLAAAGVRVLQSIGSAAVTRLDLARVDVSTMVFCGFASLFVAVLCTVAPAWLTLRRGMAPLVRSSAGPPRRGGRLQAALASAQLALAIVLVVTAALLTRTIVNLLDVPTGVRVDGALTARVMLGDRTLLSRAESHAFANRLLGELERLPGVQRAAFASSLPPATSIVQMAIRVVEGGRDETQMMALVSATPSWSEAVGVRLVDGRFLRASDAAGEHPGVVVSRSTARHLFRDRRAVGLSLPYAIPGTAGRRATVVGVVEDVRYAGLVAPLQGAVYVPWEALPFGMVRLVVRTSGDPRGLAAPIAALARRLDPSAANRGRPAPERGSGGLGGRATHLRRRGERARDYGSRSRARRPAGNAVACRGRSSPRARGPFGCGCHGAGTGMAGAPRGGTRDRGGGDGGHPARLGGRKRRGGLPVPGQRDGRGHVCHRCRRDERSGAALVRMARLAGHVDLARRTASDRRRSQLTRLRRAGHRDRLDLVAARQLVGDLHPRRDLADDRVLAVPARDGAQRDEHLAVADRRRAGVGDGERAAAVLPRLRHLGDADHAAAAAVRAAAPPVDQHHVARLRIAELDGLARHHAMHRLVVVEALLDQRQDVLEGLRRVHRVGLDDDDALGRLDAEDRGLRRGRCRGRRGRRLGRRRRGLRRLSTGRCAQRERGRRKRATCAWRDSTLFPTRVTPMRGHRSRTGQRGHSG